jgi:putative ABC transport system substrate-binding protein
VQVGLVSVLNRPGGNITGATAFTREVQGKRLAMFRELLPSASTIGTFTNPTSVVADLNLRDLEIAATKLGHRLLVLRVGRESEFETAFAELVRQGAGALFVNGSPFYSNRHQLIVAFALRNGIATIFPSREAVEAGGLMSYGASLLDSGRQAGIYAGRILKGERPGDLPVVQPTKFEFVLNLRTARALRVTIPPTLLAIADEVIE